MNKYECLLDNAKDENVAVTECFDLSGTRFKGLYCDGNIAVSNDLETSAEKACILAEELGHYHTTVGDILDQSSASNRKQEYRARLWSYNKMIGLRGIIDCHNAGCHTAYEMADHLGVTEEFLQEAIQCYRNKYGIYTIFDNYVIYFEPVLSVLELI